MNYNNQKCPCGSGLKYKKCCKLFHDGKLPKTALELMKSRYSAYATSNVAYIEKSTCKIVEDLSSFRQSVLAFCKNTIFERLDIIEFLEGEEESYITFRATLSSNAKDCSFSEKSRFIKKEQKWCYESGVIL